MRTNPQEDTRCGTCPLRLSARAVLSFVAAMMASLGSPAAHSANGDFQPLFNGRDLQGWVNVNCAADTWRATNGLIACSGAPIGELRTERMYQNFILELEWRHLKPKGNAGVFVWADALTARGQPFIRGIEVQVLDGREGPTHTSDGDIFPIHGAKMVPVNGRGGDRAFPTEKRVKPSPEWNQYRIECVDGAIALAVNGKVVTRGHDATPRKGYICLESEGSPVEFRNIRIQELPATKALAAEDIAQPAEPFKALYTGLDLSGWSSGENQNPPMGWASNDWNLDCAGGPEAKPLVWSGAIGDGVFVIDWKWRSRDQSGDWTQLVKLRGVPIAQVAQAAAAAGTSPGVEEPAGRWNRGIYRIRGNRVSIEVNGREVVRDRILEDVPPVGTLELVPPKVPVQFANLFWQRLD